jgi:hypothetical protein
MAISPLFRNQAFDPEVDCLVARLVVDVLFSQ